MRIKVGHLRSLVNEEMQKAAQLDVKVQQAPAEERSPADASGAWLMLLGDLKALLSAYQSTHWLSLGDSFYGDHLMYQRLYDDVAGELDGVAERAVGITGNDAVVEPSTLLAAAGQSLKVLVAPGEFAASMLAAEKSFLKRIAGMLELLKQSSCLTDGIENLLQGVADKHEEHVFLLSRRVSQK